MPDDLAVAQVLVIASPNGPAAVARSADCPPAWEEAAVTAAGRFGPRPPGVRCPAAVFAVPVGRTHVAVVQVADVPGPGEPLGFRFLILTRRLYAALGDPFGVADRFPPDWAARGELPPLAWPAEPPPRRTVEAVHRLLRGAEGGESPQDNSLLLGGAQALLDGERVAVVRAGPDADFVRGLWMLLPDRTRAELWPASFAFSTELGFHAAALPAADPWPAEYLTEEQTRDYPEGRYELAVQTAAEAGDQGELDRLFARRSSRDVLRIAAALVGAALLAAVVSKVLL